MSVAASSKPRPRLRVAHLSAEISTKAKPIFSTGQGLAFVAGTVPPAERALGLNSGVFSIRFKGAQNIPAEPVLTTTVTSPWGTEEQIKTYQTTVGANNTPVFLMEHPLLSERDKPYDHEDDVKRFALANLSALHLMKERKKTIDVLVCHDWHFGLVPGYLEKVFKDDPFWQNTKTVFWLHDIAFQGNFPPHLFRDSGLPWHLAMPPEVEYYKWASIGKGAMFFSDVTEGSTANYIAKIQDPANGRGFDGIARRLAQDGSQDGKQKGRLVAVCESDNVWNPSMGEPSAAAAEEMAKRSNGVYRTLIDHDYIGSELALPPLPLGRRTYLFMRPEETLASINPAAKALYGKLDETQQAVVEKFIKAGEEVVFAKIETQQELADLIDDLMQIDLERFASQRDLLVKYRTSGGSSNMSCEEKDMEPVTDLPPISAPNPELAAFARPRMRELVRAVVAGGAATRFFGGAPKTKANFVLEGLDGKSFMRIQEEDIKAAQQKYEVSIPYLILVSPGSLGDSIRQELESRGYALTSQPNPRLWVYRDKDNLEVILTELGFVLPTMTSEGRLCLLTGGKRVRFAPPGHGIFFKTLMETGAYKEIADRGKKTMFLSTIDNLGADISSDFYATILGHHLRENSLFTAEMVEPKKDDGGIGIKVKGIARIGERYTVYPSVWEHAKNIGSPFNPFNFTLSIPNIPCVLKELPWQVERKRNDEKGVEEKYREFFQTVKLAGDFSLFVDSRFIMVPRDWRFIPNKNLDDVKDATRLYLEKWGNPNYR